MLIFDKYLLEQMSLPWIVIRADVVAAAKKYLCLVHIYQQKYFLEINPTMWKRNKWHRLAMITFA